MLYVVKEWQDPNGRWHVGCVDQLAKGSNYWWISARMLNIPLTDFIEKLVNEFNVDKMYYFERSNLLLYSWENYNDAHRWLLYLNREARARNFQI